MSFYRRFISYMYDVSDTAKRKNCGFVKVEVRGNKCTFLFQLKGAPCQGNCKLYLCQRNGDPKYIFLKNILVIDGNACCRADTHSQKMANQNLCFEQCCGILCIDEKMNQCGTCWDNTGTLPEYTKTNEIAESNAAPVVKDSTEIKESIETTINHDLSEETSFQNEETSHTITISENDSEAPINSETSQNSFKEQPNSSPKTFSEVWEHLQKEFSSMDPFEDDAIVETIKISPSDLGYLQSFNINLGSNQFLLHGYKSYHHLLLGRLHGQNQYILGIPGIYDPQEQFMAKMFGFPCFKPIRECRQKNGQFGYWMKCFR